MTDYVKIENAQNAISDLLKQMGVEAEVKFEDSITKGLVFNIETPDPYLLIGRQGSTLHALQVLAQAIAGSRSKGQPPLYFTIDVDDYKMKREWYLRETAKQAADKVKKTGRSQALEPMPAYERRYIHAYIQENFADSILTESIGQEPRRKLIVKLKK